MSQYFSLIRCYSPEIFAKFNLSVHQFTLRRAHLKFRHTGIEVFSLGFCGKMDGSKHPMKRDKFGVCSIWLADEGGVSVIPRGSKVKFSMQKGDGTWVDRLPAWIKFAVVDPNVFAAYYDGFYWNPPASERTIAQVHVFSYSTVPWFRYKFTHPRVAKLNAPLICQVHVGMSPNELQVTSYRQFEEVLHRMKANSYNTIQLMAIIEHV